jgi:hypothetical protein
MQNKMFGHRIRRKANSARTPGEPYNDNQYDKGNENEESFKYVKGKDSFQHEKGIMQEKAKAVAPGYEGKEHVKYRDPGHTRHNIRIPEDEPHMKSHVTQDESHEMEDNFHMGVPDQTDYDLPAKIKRARMKMDAPDQEDPDYLRGDITHPVGYEGEDDTSGEEKMGPNDMQMNSSKQGRKKMIVSVMKRKMKKPMKSDSDSSY